MRTRDLVKQLGLDPTMEWKRGWKVVKKQVDGQGETIYLSCAAPQPLEYEIGEMRSRYIGDGPLAGWQYKRDARIFKEQMEECFGFDNKPLFAALFPMLYTHYNCQPVTPMGFLLWQRLSSLRGTETIPTGTVLANTIVIYGKEVEI